jgi:hypothetical protein
VVHSNAVRLGLATAIAMGFAACGGGDDDASKGSNLAGAGKAATSSGGHAAAGHAALGSSTGGTSTGESSSGGPSAGGSSSAGTSAGGNRSAGGASAAGRPSTCPATSNAGESAEGGATEAGGAGAGGAPATIDAAGCHWQSDLPPGSYLGSCSNCTLVGTVLSCSCLDSSGGLRLPTTLILSSCPSGDIANCNGSLVLDGCFEYNHQGACDTRSIDSRCVEYTASQVPSEEPQCAARCGIWRTKACPVPDVNTHCCDYDDVHVCATGSDAIMAMYQECMSRNICHC